MPKSAKPNNGWMVLVEEVETPNNQCNPRQREDADCRRHYGDRLESPRPCLPPLQQKRFSSPPSNFVMSTPVHFLAEVDEAITFKAVDDVYACQLRIQNVEQDCNAIIFKIKTSTPDHYKVRPTIAVIEPGSCAIVPIISVEGVTCAQIKKDRFQVQVCTFPREMVDDDCQSGNSSTESNHNSYFADLNNTFKRISGMPGCEIDTFNVTVCIESGPGQGQGVTCAPIESEARAPLSTSMNDGHMGSQMDDLEMRVTKSVVQTFGSRLDRIQNLLYFILGLILAYFVTALFWSTEPEKTCQDGCNKDGGCGCSSENYF